jgi:hypothetical protein
MKLNKVAFAVASALAIAAGASHAGQINSSSTTLATEVIWSDAQVVRAPSVAYTFAGSIDARTNEQRLQLQFTLEKGQWASGATLLVPATGLSADLLASGVLKVAYTDGANATQTVLPVGSTVKAFLANNATTLVFNVTIPAAAAAPNLLRDAVWTLNADGNVGIAGNNTGITKLLSVAGAAACTAPNQAMNINFKHFSNHNGTAVDLKAADATPDSEHVRVGSTNDARYLGFTQDLKFNFAAAAASSQVNSATLRTTFLNTAVTYAGIAAPANRVHTLGTVTLARASNGLDLDYTTQYGAALNAAAFDTTFAAWVRDGKVDVAATGLTIKVDGNMAKGSQIALVDNLGAAVGAPSTALAADAATTTVSLTTAADIAKVAAGLVTVVYVVDGVNVIPDNGAFNVTATLNKDRTGAVAANEAEQDNVCAAPLTGLGNSGIKIDVRNYASFAKFGATGPATTLRIINNSETRTADLYAQMIYANGTYGAWGRLSDLAPRAVLNISNKDLEAAMTTAPAVSNPFGANAVGYATTGTNAVVAGASNGIGDRIRIISNTGSTLRVQSYMVVGNVVLDTSNGQGVDFENLGANRAPGSAVDAQPLSQDAINGLSK